MNPLEEEKHKLEKEIRRLENRQKILLNKRSRRGAQGPTRRLIERGAILESVFPALAGQPAKKSRRFCFPLPACPEPGESRLKNPRNRDSLLKSLACRARLHRSGVCALPEALRPMAAMGPTAPNPSEPHGTEHPLCGYSVPCGLIIPTWREVLSIAIYHCTIKIIKRGEGRSAVARPPTEAARSSSTNGTGMTHDPTQRAALFILKFSCQPMRHQRFKTAPPSGTAWRKLEKSSKSGLPAR